MVIVQLRYSFRVYPSAGQRLALGRAFGCVRVVFNDALRVREAARCAGLPFVAFGELSRQLTVAKKTPERAWLAEVSSVVLQQSLRDLDIAYRNFFDGLKGKRPRMGAPGFKSRKDTRQAIRFTANAGWKVTAGGKLRLPKVGDLAVKWSRSLPSSPSTVTVIKDSAGRYFASFVVETEPGTLPDTGSAVGIDRSAGKTGTRHGTARRNRNPPEAPTGDHRQADGKLRPLRRRGCQGVSASLNRVRMSRVSTSSSAGAPVARRRSCCPKTRATAAPARRSGSGTPSWVRIRVASRS